MKKHTELTLYYAGSQQCLEDHQYGPAVRTHYLLHFILEGQGRFTKGTEIYDLKKGDAFLIRPGEVTIYQADSELPWKYTWVAFDGPNIIEILDEAGLAYDCVLTFKENFETMKQTFINLSFDFRIHNRHPFLHLTYLYKIFYECSTLKKRKEKHSKNEYVEQALDFIDVNYHRSITIQTIADAIGLERTYFYRIFKQNMEVSPSKYLIMHRINASLKLLEETMLNVTTIAHSCGFSDISSYCRHFKRIVKITPKQYRENVQS